MPDINHAETKKLVTSIAAKVLLLFDAGRLGRMSFACSTPIDTIVMCAIGEADRARVEDSGINLLVAW